MYKRQDIVNEEPEDDNQVANEKAATEKVAKEDNTHADEETNDGSETRAPIKPSDKDITTGGKKKSRKKRQKKSKRKSYRKYNAKKKTK